MKFLAIALCFVLVGCVRNPPPAGPTSYAGYVGDRLSISLDEVIVTVQGAAGHYSNLHVAISAIVNLKVTTSSTYGDVDQIVRRLEPRISARVVEVALGAKAVTPADLPPLRDRVALEAQRAFDSAFAQWTYAPDWDVRLAVTSMYLTNGAVGRGGTRSRW